MVYQDLVIKLRFIVFHASRGGPDTNAAYVDLPIMSSTLGNAMPLPSCQDVPAKWNRLERSLRLRFVSDISVVISESFSISIYIFATHCNAVIKIFKSEYLKSYQVARRLCLDISSKKKIIKIIKDFEMENLKISLIFRYIQWIR